MFFYIIIFILIVFLIYTNALTDAPNAISTVVGTKVLKFKEAALISALFNLLGIIVMSIFNFSVADFMFSMIDMSDRVNGLSIIFSAIISVILFANIALFFGIPTSETHALIAGITGALIACNKIESISINNWIDIFIGLIFSIVGTFLITKIIDKLFRKKLDMKVSNTGKRKLQILSSGGTSFMHGAQDGQKFIGVIIAFQLLIQNKIVDYSNAYNINQENYFWIIILVSIIMFVGVATGGKKIVDTLGSKISSLSSSDALISDFSTIFVLLFSSLNGIPISTSHVKTISIISAIDKEKRINFEKVQDIFKAWVFTFPVCMFISFVCMKILMIVL